MFQHIIFVTMQPEHLDIPFDNLLDFSTISPQKHDQASSLYDLSVSKDKLNLTEKERTREQSYEEIIKKINSAKLQQVRLEKELLQLKTETHQKYLGKMQQQIDFLNQENHSLRQELNLSSRKMKEIRDDRSERYSNRSSFKVKSSVNSVYGDQNKETHSKKNHNQVSPNMIIKRKDPKLTESTTHLGRSQVNSPKYHKRRESQLTERKQEQNSSMGISFYQEDKAEEFNIRQSISKQSLRPESRNVFIQILTKMLKQEQSRDNQKYLQLYLQSTRKPKESPQSDLCFINSMESEIRQTNQKLQMLKMVMERYQLQIEDLNINLRNVGEWNEKLYKVKGKYVQMEQKCQQLIQLRSEVQDKENMLNRKKLQQNKDQLKNIGSVETLIKIFTNNPNKSFPFQASKLYHVYYREIKELFRYEKEDQHRRQQKLVKVKQMIDNIRESRKKFNQLIQIYEGRIEKVEEKIRKMRGVEGSGKQHSK